MDLKIQSIFRETNLTPEEKFTQIRGVGLERTQFQAKGNSILVNKLMQILDAVTTSATEVMNEKITNMQSAFAKRHRHTTVL